MEAFHFQVEDPIEQTRINLQASSRTYILPNVHTIYIMRITRDNQTSTLPPHRRMVPGARRFSFRTDVSKPFGGVLNTDQYFFGLHRNTETLGSAPHRR
jgi:hypothetical protein